jgi:hypothetical protein
MSMPMEVSIEDEDVENAHTHDRTHADDLHREIGAELPG